jgi:hypothetical protein
VNFHLQEKKGGATESGDPFTDIATKILEEAEKWRKSTFQVAREVYEKDEALCSALEQAIWVRESTFPLTRGSPRLTNRLWGVLLFFFVV